MSPAFTDDPSPLIEDCREVIRAGDATRLLVVAKHLHAADLAALYEDLDANGRQFFLATVGPGTFAPVLAELPNSLVDEALDHFEPEVQREILEALPDDDRVDILQDVDVRRQGEFLSLLGDDYSEDTRTLLRYDEETAGGRMTTQIGRVFQRMTVGEAVEVLRPELDNTLALARIFVVDAKDKLRGIVRLRDLAFNPWSTPIADLMVPAEHAVLATVDQEEAAAIQKRYDLVLLPVLDESGRLLGAISADDAMEILEEESTEDIEKGAGLTGERSEESYLNTRVWTHFRRRAGWLLGLAVLAILSGYVMLRFEGLLSSIYILSLFLPMVIAAGGNTGGQASTMVIRAMALGELGLPEFLRVAWKELRLGLALGSFLGLTIAAVIIGFLPAFNPSLPEGITYFSFGLAVACAMAAQVTTSTLIGGLLPIFARAVKLDPAVIAAPAVTTVVDVTGMVIYFSVARLFLGV